VSWRKLEAWPYYEMNRESKLRLINGNIQYPMLIGPHGYVGFLMQQGMCWYLIPLHELYPMAFPELVQEDDGK
jgi:hypothetical protein